MPVEALDNAAWKKAREMAKPNHTKDHQDTEGARPRGRAKKSDYGYETSASKTLTPTVKSAQAVVKDWIGKPEDRKKLLNRNFTVTGVAFYRNCYVQVFGHDSRK